MMLFGTKPSDAVARTGRIRYASPNLLFVFVGELFQDLLLVVDVKADFQEVMSVDAQLVLTEW
jgi:hypothetical protein